MTYTSDWPRGIPVAVNDCYGDPFIIEQVPGTLDKVQQLMDQTAPIALFTKAPLNPAVLPYLRDIAANPMVIPFYSLTGLGEGGYDFDHRRRMIDTMGAIFGDVVILTRPIIAGRNDHPDNLARLVRVAAEGSRIMVLGGIHDAKKRKRMDNDVEQMLFDMCRAADVRAFHKSSCLGAYLYGLECWNHDMGTPRNLDALPELGYTHTLDEEGSVVLGEASTGDLNFLRILTMSEIRAGSIISNYNLLTVPSGDRPYECTSSWMEWSENIDTCLGCSYCIILQIEYLKKTPRKVGTHPRDMISTIQNADGATDFSRFRKTKLPGPGDRLHSYGDVRVVKTCVRHAYDAAPWRGATRMTV
ncbi:hypothetical protein [Streptomyces blastmyceticus]|uniref:Uncharacterized protein n=1 Tax=Streptomyces blastmyceticus TaxID=68180 RepID=A0ABP3G1W4_9ACTN